jgi:hypothetical protein
LIKQKTRDCFGNRGFFEILFVCALEVSSHDAEPAGAMPLGRLSIDWLAAQADVHNAVHQIRGKLAPSTPMSKDFFSWNASAGIAAPCARFLPLLLIPRTMPRCAPV